MYCQLYVFWKHFSCNIRDSRQWLNWESTYAYIENVFYALPIFNCIYSAKLIINNIYQYLPSFCFLQTILKSLSDIFRIVFSTVLMLSQLTTSVLNHPHNFQHRHHLFWPIKLKIWLINCTLRYVWENLTLTVISDKYSRIDQVNFFKGCLAQILLGPFLNTLFHMLLRFKLLDYDFFVSRKKALQLWLRIYWRLYVVLHYSLSRLVHLFKVCTCFLFMDVSKIK